MQRSLVILLPALVILSQGCGPKKAPVGSVAALETFVSEAKRPLPNEKPAEGSLWTNRGRRANLFRDPRAHDVNDIVTIRVIESTQASSVADAKNSKNTEVKSGVDNFFGLENKVKELPAMVAGKTANTFEGKGSTTRATTLETNVAARVVDVLPNGYLVVEALKDIRVNNENQSLHLTGVIRPEDISRGNVILSSAVSQMTIKLQGRGVVSQPLNPGWLYRILNGILPF